MTASGSAAKTKEVVERHVKTLLAGDLAGVMADYAPDAVLVRDNGVLKGAEQLKKMFAGAIAAGGLKTFKLVNLQVEGELAIITWNSLPAIAHGTDTFVVRNGKIVGQTVFVVMAAK